MQTPGVSAVDNSISREISVQLSRFGMVTHKFEPIQSVNAVSIPIAFLLPENPATSGVKVNPKAQILKNYWSVKLTGQVVAPPIPPNKKNPTQALHH